MTRGPIDSHQPGALLRAGSTANSLYTRNLLAACIALSVWLSTAVLAAGTEAIPAMTHKVVLQKDGDHYRWQLIEAPIAPLGDNQVLLHVHAVSLNRGDADMLAGKSDRDLTGFVAGTDAAG